MTLILSGTFFRESRNLYPRRGQVSLSLTRLVVSGSVGAVRAPVGDGDGDDVDDEGDDADERRRPAQRRLLLLTVPRLRLAVAASSPVHPVHARFLHVLMSSAALKKPMCSVTSHSKHILLGDTDERYTHFRPVSVEVGSGKLRSSVDSTLIAISRSQPLH